MSDINFSCPQCNLEIACDVSYIGSEVSCPGCDATITVPKSTVAAKNDFSKSHRPKKKKQSATGFTLAKQSLVALVVGLLLAPFFPSPFFDIPPELELPRFKTMIAGFLVGFGGSISVIAGYMILINAFRESKWWGLGFFAPIVGGLVWFAFVFTHWNKNGRLFLANLGGTILVIIGVFGFGMTAIVGGVLSMAVEGLDDADLEYMPSDSPAEAFSKFQEMAKIGAYSEAFKYVAPGLQDESLDMLVMTALGAQMMPGDDNMKKFAADSKVILENYGLSTESLQQGMISAMTTGTSEREQLAARYAGVRNKGELYRELASAASSMGPEMAEIDTLSSLAAVKITNPSIIGDTARSESTMSAGELGEMKIAIHFRRRPEWGGRVWVISEIEMLDMEEMIAKLNQQFGELDGTGFGKAGVNREYVPEVEDKVLAFHIQNANAGQQTAQYELGMRYLKGSGVKQDFTLAKHWLSESANQGYSRAKKELATLERRLKQEAETEARFQSNLSRLTGESLEAGNTVSR